MDAQQVTPSPSLFCPMKHLLDTYLQQARHHLIQREWWASWAGIIAGCTILAVGFVVFINPYNIVPGGVYGLSIVLHNLFPSIQVGTFGYMFDIPLLILSVWLLGSKLGTRTIVAALLTPTLMNLITALVYPPEALHSLDPAFLAGGRLDLSHHLILTTIVGGAVIGIGSGLVVKSQASTGGSDIIALIMQKYMGIRFSRASLMVDGLVVLCGLLVIGFGIGQGESEASTGWYLSLYSLVSIYIISQVISYVINGAKDDKLIFVISDLDLVPLHRFILHDMDRTATRIKSSGLYTGKEKEMLFLVVKQGEVDRVKHTIKEADPRAFVVVTDAYDTFGEGWKSLPSKDDIIPE